MAELTDIELQLFPSRETLVAGDLWNVQGEITNHSKVAPVWIIDARSTLTFAPEVYGAASNLLTVPGNFPTIIVGNDGIYDHAIRVDPGAKYDVAWKIMDPDNTDNMGGINTARNIRSFLTDPIRAVVNYAYFYPGKFRTTATVHVWNVPPTFDDLGRVTNLSDSTVVTVSQGIAMDPSPWVLIVGASVGGVLCYLVQVFVGAVRVTKSRPEKGFLRALFWIVWRIGLLVAGLIGAILISGVGTVLLARLSTSEFLVAVKVQDVWGAIATGFVLQGLGYPRLRRLFTGGDHQGSNPPHTSAANNPTGTPNPAI